MFQNNKKTLLTSTRWAFIINFLHSNHTTIKSLLLSNLPPDMMRTDVYLTNIAEGALKLSAETILPEGGNRVLVCSLIRPPLFYPLQIRRDIEELRIADLLLTVSNQVEVLL